MKFLFWLCNIYKDGKPNYKNESIDRKIFLKTLSNQFLKVKSSLLELEKDFIELNNIELKDEETT